jgi:uncharacterized damage-inducible protein DinB
MTFPREFAEAGHLYLERDASVLSTEQIIERVQAAAERLREAAESLSDDAFVRARDDGWSGEECLKHVVGWNIINAQQILYVALAGELPPEAAPEIAGSRDEVLSKHQEALDSLYVHVREADPQGFLHVRWAHPFFGELNWREWLLFLELHCTDHTGQLGAMARA